MAETLPALPDPQNAALARLPDVLAQSALARAYCEEHQDLVMAQELKRRLDALQKYISDKGARERLAGESRLTEILIGKLLGPPRQGVRTDLTSSTVDEVPIHDQYRHDFRKLAEREADVRELVASGVVERKKILRELGRRDAQKKASHSPPLAQLRRGDFRDVLSDISDDSVDLIFTDPPYDKESVPLYGDLAEFASRVLKPGGSLLAYCGQYALPEVIALTTAHLRWWWLCGCYHEGGNHKSLPGIKTYVLWKPIIWLVKGTNNSEEFVHDMVARQTPDKSQHDWSQSPADAEHYISKLCPFGGLVVDPFVGAATTLVVAKMLGRSWIGAELDVATELRARSILNGDI